MTPTNATPSLVWNVKSSFRAYVLAAGGAVEVTLPATEIDAGFCFPSATNEAAGNEGTIQFMGSVSFKAHAGALNVLIKDPWIHIEDFVTRLSIAGSEATRTAGGRLFMAELDHATPSQSEQQLAWTNVATRLTGEGAVVFDFNYPIDSELAPVSFSVLIGG